MKLTAPVSIVCSLLAINVACTPTPTQQEYKPEWSSLARHEIPQWLHDAKFGIYTHWGPQTYYKSVPLGEIDFIEGFDGWRAENFDAAAWAKLFKESGAQFAGPVAQHCTGCVNWDSEITEWNSTNYGPKRDIVGELEREIKKQGMKFMVSLHTVATAGIWGEMSKENRTYIEPDTDMAWDYNDREDQRWMQGWIDRIEEVTTKYGVDMLWFDSSLGKTIRGELDGFIVEGKYYPEASIKSTHSREIGGLGEQAQQQFIANYYNYGLHSGREVDIVYKSRDVPRNIGMRTFERGNMNGQQYDPWMTDLSLHHTPVKSGKWMDEAWFYSDRNTIIEVDYVVDLLIDIVSKNGRILLNAPPRPDGTFDEKTTSTLLEIGAWLKVNGEGIYDTTPWALYGEGPGEFAREGHFALVWGTGRDNPFTYKDIRYTTKGPHIYAFVLGTPEQEEVRFLSLGSYNKLYPNEVKGVKLLGYDGQIEWSHEADALVVKWPRGVKESHAYCFKVER